MGTSFENGISVSFLAFLENNANIFYLKTGFSFFWGCDGNIWKIMPISSIWERNFRVFSGLVMGTSFEHGISVSFWAFLENNANIFYLKTGFPFFWACDGNLWKIMTIASIWKRDFRCFFGLLDGNLWKIISISSIWKRNFRVFSGRVMGTSFENGLSVSFWAFLENNANIFYLKTGFSCFFFGLWWEPHLKTGCPCLFGLFWKIMPISSIWKRDFRFFLACDGNLWKIISISSIWKRNFRVFSGLVMGTSFENGLSVSFWAFLENNANIFYLKTGFPCFFLACDGNLWEIIPISSIWKREFPFFGLEMATSGK